MQLMQCIYRCVHIFHTWELKPETDARVVYVKLATEQTFL